MHPFTLVLIGLLAGCAVAAAAQDRRPDLDLREAVVVTPETGVTPVERQAVRMLVEEVEERTGIRWPVVHEWPSGGKPVVAVGPATAAGAFAGPFSAELATDAKPPGREGYRIRIRPAGPTPAALAVGADPRGTLYGVGYLLRKLHMERGAIRMPAGPDVSTEPKVRVRGHQLGYRPKTNSYDGWTLAMWEQYFRDLIIFGANAIELIPPRSDDDADSPHFPLPPMETMVGMSRLADQYGLDVWIWYPAMDADYSKPETVDFALKEWDEVFRRLPRIDAVFVPGGDPGHTQPRHLMALLEKQTASLQRRHPKAEMWVSPQSFSAEWMDEFLAHVRDKNPAWLAGVVYGPQVRITLAELRAALPERVPIRHYPDITHGVKCQFPIPDWDLAYALTEGREPINPRPMGMARIFRHTNPNTVGFLAYSEGCNDDVNKAVWSGLGWNPDTEVVEILRDYGRCFVGPRFTEGFAQGLLALERNWQGPLLTNAGVETTLQQFQAMERAAGPRERSNWRFQQALYRAYYDAFVRYRLLHETTLQERAMDSLRQASGTGSNAALDRAEAVLEEAVSRPAAHDLRARVFELAEALFQSIRMQLSVPRYKAIAVGRGANLDTIDAPLNDRLWLMRRFAAIRALPDETARLDAIAEIVNWQNPGPGGFYDEPGNPERRPHLVLGPGFGDDPAFQRSAVVGFVAPSEERMSWSRHAEPLHDQPIRMRYEGLHPSARYRVRVVYGGERTRGKLRLEAGKGIEVHPWMDKPFPMKPLEWDIPAEAIEKGELTLTWRREPGLGGNGRGCQLAEVWLIRTGD